MVYACFPVKSIFVCLILHFQLQQLKYIVITIIKMEQWHWDKHMIYSNARAMGHIILLGLNLTLWAIVRYVN